MSEDRKRTRRHALRALGSAAIAGLAGCNTSGSSGADGQPTETRSATPTPTETATPESATETEHTDSEQSAGPPDSVEFVRNPEEVHPTLKEATSVGADEVLLGLRLEDSSLPFDTQVYHAPEDAAVHTTKTYDTQDLSQVEIVPESERTLDTVDTDREDVHYGKTKVGEPLTVTLVAQHDGETFDWSAWDRTGYPYDGHANEDPGLEVACYCSGMIYSAPSGGTWARVIQVTPTEVVDAGTTVVLNWTSSRLAD